MNPAVSTLSIQLQPLGLFLVLFFVHGRYRRFFRFFGSALLISLYVLYFFLLLFIEYAWHGLALIDCHPDPWGRSSVSSGVINRFCLSEMTSSVLNVTKGVQILDGERLRPFGYNHMLEYLFLQGFVLIIPVVTYLNTSLYQTVTNLRDDLQSLKGRDYNMYAVGKEIRDRFSTNLNYVGINVVVYEVSSLLVTLGIVVINGNLLQNEFSLNWDTWLFGWRAMKSLGWSDEKSENLFPSMFLCPVPETVQDFVGPAKSSYFFCKLGLMSSYQHFFTSYWALLMIHVTYFIFRCLRRLVAIASPKVRKASLHRALLSLCSNNRDKRYFLADFLSQTHCRFVLITSIIDLYDVEEIQEVLSHLFRFNQFEFSIHSDERKPTVGGGTQKPETKVTQESSTWTIDTLEDKVTADENYETISNQKQNFGPHTFDQVPI